MATLDMLGADGGTLLGFLAAIGSLRLLAETDPTATLAFDRADDHAVLGSSLKSTSDAIVEAVVAGVRSQERVRELEVLGDRKKPGDVTATDLARWAAGCGALPDLRAIVAGLVCDLADDGKAGETTLCAANGAGHQNMFQTLADLRRLATEGHVRAALTSPWTFEDRVPADASWMGSRKPTLRWDEAAERLYALRRNNPTDDPEPFRTQLGAYALAAAALPCFPVVPTARGPRTVFTTSERRATIDFHWPLWERPISLVAFRAIHASGEALNDPVAVRARGVYRLMRARRSTLDKGKLVFSPAEGVW